MTLQEDNKKLHEQINLINKNIQVLLEKMQKLQTDIVHIKEKIEDGEGA